MEKEKQVCGLELAKQLKELGVPQDSLFYWDMRPTNNGIEIKPRGIFYQKPRNGAHDYIISAFTVAELGEMMPNYKEIYKQFNTYHVDGYGWKIEPAIPNDDAFTLHFADFGYAETEADARAKMLIWLIKEGYLDIKELNNA